MKKRDVERSVPKDRFIKTLRRIADSLEKSEAFRIQVDNMRLSVPWNAELSVEHEAEDGKHELELQFKWDEE